MLNLALRPRPLRAVGLVLAAVAAGCYSGARGTSGDDDAAGEANEGDSDIDDASEGSDGGDGDDDDGDSPDAQCEGDEGVPAPLPNLVRLTHRQYDNTIRDLLGLDEHPSAVFLPDVSLAGFDNNAELLFVGDRLARDYRRAAEDLAGRVVAAPELLAAIVPCDPSTGDAGCADAFIRWFGGRAFRRTLRPEERTAYAALYASAPGLYPSGTDFEQGIRFVIEAMLQSPSFLYRVELSSPQAGEAMAPLDGFEIATRLSYLFWNSTPDDELLAAAADGLLDDPEGIEEQARRLLDDPRAADPVADFHAQWLEAREYLDVAKDPQLFPGWSLDMGDAMQEESRRFIERVVFELAGGYTDLLTTPSSVVDARLAAIYGVQVPDDGAFHPVELDPGQRAGILTQVGFLASRAYPSQSSPIHRGVFVQRKLLCAALPDPPGDIDPNLPPLEGEIHTTRDAVEAHTAPQQCSGCHALINAPGFALEGYDAIGRVRTEENGWPLDTAVTLQIDGEAVAIDGGVGLAQAIAESEQGQRCYATQWFRYANMRAETPDDHCTIDGLVTALADEGMPVQDLMIALTQTKTFRNRTVAP